MNLNAKLLGIFELLFPSLKMKVTDVDQNGFDSIVKPLRAYALEKGLILQFDEILNESTNI